MSDVVDRIIELMIIQESNEVFSFFFFSVRLNLVVQIHDINVFHFV